MYIGEGSGSRQVLGLQSRYSPDDHGTDWFERRIGLIGLGGGHLVKHCNVESTGGNEGVESGIGEEWRILSSLS